MIEQLFSFPSSMLWPLAACLVLTGIHVYLGVHVIARKVIFVDLALAQIAALGTVTGVLLGYEVGKDITALYLYSLAFTIFGAFVFSATRMKSEKVPHEAIIGIVYAVTFAATILVLSKSALGPQELDHIIKGELLWVQPHMVIKTAIIYALVGLFHFTFRKKFMAISFDAAAADASGMNVRFWDFLFYMSFGFVITSSVAIAGVFLVFSYLVIPSVGAMLVTDKLGKRLALGWIGGAVISFYGVKLSWSTGLPTSPLIVVLFAGALLLTGIYRYLKTAEKKAVAIRNMAAAVGVVVVFFGAVLLLRKGTEDPLVHTLHLLSSPMTTDREAALMDLRGHTDKQDLWVPAVVQHLSDSDAVVRADAVKLLAEIRATSALPAILARLDDRSDQVVLNVIYAVRSMGDSTASVRLLERARNVDDPELKTELLQAAMEMGNPEAIGALITVVQLDGVFGDEAFDVLNGHVPLPAGRDQPAKLSAWWAQNRGKLTWDPSGKVFKVSAR